MDLIAKNENLKEIINKLGSVAIAFSGGVDSTYLLKTAHDVLGDKAIAITIKPHSFPRRELDESIAFCEKEGIKHIVLDFNELEIPGFKANPKDRCYICKKALFTSIIEVANQNGANYVLEGSNMDDNNDYRPGMKAIKELNVLSPLKEAKLYKNEIRELSHNLGLSTWDKPSLACLATRFVYGEEITEEKLSMVEKAEQYLFDLGFKQLRVRVHSNIARIEVEEKDFKRVLEYRNDICEKFKQYGFGYVSLDLMGYRTGSMNETIV